MTDDCFLNKILKNVVNEIFNSEDYDDTQNKLREYFIKFKQETEKLSPFNFIITKKLNKKISEYHKTHYLILSWNRRNLLIYGILKNKFNFVN